jgi:hypothetical protein
MRHSARTATSRRARHVHSDPAQDDPHDAIDLEFLRLWMGLSQLRARLRDDRRATRKPPAPDIMKSAQKAARRKAA